MRCRKASVFPVAQAKIAEDPQRVLALDISLDRLEQPCIVEFNALRANLPVAAWGAAGAFDFFSGHERPVAVFNDVAVPEVQIGREPRFHPLSLYGRASRRANFKMVDRFCQANLE